MNPFERNSQSKDTTVPVRCADCRKWKPFQEKVTKRSDLPDSSEDPPIQSSLGSNGPDKIARLSQFGKQTCIRPSIAVKGVTRCTRAGRFAPLPDPEEHI